jgi:uncharacterized repeat protein (TIGR01451 family)
MKLKICLLTSLIFASLAFAQDGPLESLLDVYRVDFQELADGTTVEVLIEAEEAAPGEMLEYVLTYRNTGEQVLRGFVIKNRVPENTSYLAESDSADIGAEFLVSIDYGITWEDVPVTRTVTDSSGNERTITIPAEQYTNISWVVNEDLEPENQFELRYRVTIL